ncbi:MAG: MupG family TIM beta-alpha barrel fold protein [Lachnospiraceae bacterium]
MFKKNLNFSVYVSSITQQQEMLLRNANKDMIVFVSLHIEEEFSKDYVKQVEEMCVFLNKNGFRIIADVSCKTKVQFNEENLVNLARRLNLWALRMDYGISDKEMQYIAMHMPIVLNASTIDKKNAKNMIQNGANVYAMHNFYPRPETGLDVAYFLESNSMLRELGMKVFAFIPGDCLLRGPLYETLPTLEHHRNMSPYVCWMEHSILFGTSDVFVADPLLSKKEEEYIKTYLEEKIVSIPVTLDKSYQYLYGMIFTNRVDSPSNIIRFAESREYATKGKVINPYNCIERMKGSITIDNIEYGRYSGEVQIVCDDFEANRRINVIGSVKSAYLSILSCVKRNEKFMLVK